MLFFDCINRCMARNQRDGPSLLEAKIVPLMTLHWCRQAEHCRSSRPSRRNALSTPQPQSGQMKPWGHRDWIGVASHPASLAKALHEFSDR